MRARFCNPTWKEIISSGGLILKVLVELSCFAIWNYGFESFAACPRLLPRGWWTAISSCQKTPWRLKWQRWRREQLQKYPGSCARKWRRRVHEALNLNSRITILTALSCMCWILWWGTSDASNPISISSQIRLVICWGIPQATAQKIIVVTCRGIWRTKFW